MRAQEAYAALSDDNKTLTFYYDNQKASRNGMSVGPFNAVFFKGWNAQSEAITTVRFDASFASYTELTSTAYWFTGCKNLTIIEGIKNLKTDNVTSMVAMFENCSSLTSLDLSNFNTSNVTDMPWMFNYCSGLTSLDVSHFNTENVMRMGCMFQNCSSLTSLDVSGFNTSNVTNIYNMFFGCSSLTNLDVSGFNTEKVTGMGSMFSGCSSLTTIYAGAGWSMGNLKSSAWMFGGCTSLVGGQGTTYNDSHTDGSYAHIDGGTSNPGYFTSKSLKGDANLDGTVSIADGVAVLNAMAGQEVPGNPDVNGDKELGIADFVSVLNIMAGQ